MVMNVSRKRLSAGLSSFLLSIAGAAMPQDGAQEELAADLVSEIENAAAEALRACANEVESFCSDVTPGEGRVLACMQAYRDRVGSACDVALTQWQGPDILADFKTTRLYPTLEHRDLGEPNLDNAGERVIWPYRLPFLGQKVIDLGFDLPNPYGVAIIPAGIRQDLVLEDLAIGVNGPADTEIDFVDFGGFHLVAFD